MSTIRKATPADATAMTELVNSVYRGERALKGWTTEAHLISGPRITVAGMEALLRAPKVAFLVAENAGKIVGCVKLEHRGADFILGMLSVDVDHQSGGLGRKLVRAGEEYLKEQMGADAVILYVIQGRDELIAWYQRQGYTDSGRREPFPDDQPETGTPNRKDLQFILLRREMDD